MSTKWRLRGRPINGMVLLDKPLGITSNKALQITRALFQARKAGHTGSLDSLASGLLPICFGVATKLSAFLLNADKHYLVTYKLGEVSTTCDGEGEIICRRPVPNLDRSTVEKAMASLCGEILQIPPMYSALKYKGQRLYKLARQGVTVDREPRPVTIYNHHLIAFQDDWIKARVSCSKGTYIRTLAADLGEIIGCGARVEALRRIGVGAHSDKMVLLATLQQDHQEGILDKHMQPPEAVLDGYPDIHVSASAVFYLYRGEATRVQHDAPAHELVKLYVNDDQFIGVGQVLEDGRIASRRLIRAPRKTYRG